MTWLKMREHISTLPPSTRLLKATMFPSRHRRSGRKHFCDWPACVRGVSQADQAGGAASTNGRREQRWPISDCLKVTCPAYIGTHGRAQSGLELIYNLIYIYTVDICRSYYCVTQASRNPHSPVCPSHLQLPYHSVDIDHQAAGTGKIGQEIVGRNTDEPSNRG